MREKINVRNAIITAVISWIVIIILDTIISVSFFNILVDLFAGIGSFISEMIQQVVKFMNIDIKLWLVLLILIVLFIVKQLIKKVSIDSTNLNQEKPFESYTEDTFKKWRWTWRWGKSNGSWVVRDLTPYCPICNSTLLQHNNHIINDYSVECPRCSFSRRRENNEHPSKITQLIIDRAKQIEEERLKKSS